jgi:hypothetical protein
MSKKIIEWKFGGPEDALEIIRNLETKKILTAEKLVENAEDENSPLHPLFQWDNDKAGHLYRLTQARNIINNVKITVISNGEQRVIPAFEITTSNDEKIYKLITTFTRTQKEVLIDEILSTIKTLNFKLKTLKDIGVDDENINKALKELMV